MKTLSKQWQIGGAVLGAFAGFLYWHEIGCQTGHCPLQSHWQTMTLWGGVMGYLATDMLLDLKQMLSTNYGNAKETNVQ
jgi:hypothetical protein